jgi:hypothetical protein
MFHVKQGNSTREGAFSLFLAEIQAKPNLIKLSKIVLKKYLTIYIIGVNMVSDKDTQKQTRNMKGAPDMKKVSADKFYETINMGDCSVKYFNRKAYAKAINEAKPQEIPQGKKLMRDPFVGYVLVDEK